MIKKMMQILTHDLSIMLIGGYILAWIFYLWAGFLSGG
jgi:hypothetical protein